MGRKIKGIYTTGQIAKMLCCSARTISKAIDSGKLKAFRIPGGLDRRVLPEDLKTFCIENKIPLHLISEPCTTTSTTVQPQQNDTKSSNN